MASLLILLRQLHDIEVEVLAIVLIAIIGWELMKIHLHSTVGSAPGPGPGARTDEAHA
jgi:hypothetical protein